MTKWFKFACGCKVWMDDQTGEIYRHAEKDNTFCQEFMEKDPEKCTILMAYKLESATGINRGFAFNDGSSMKAIREYVRDNAIEDTIENLKEIMDANS